MVDMFVQSPRPNYGAGRGIEVYGGYKWVPMSKIMRMIGGV